MTESLARRRLAPALLLAAVAPVARAQAHLLVPSQFAEIGLAVQAAAPGDVIEVTERFPQYQPFVIDRPITIVGIASQNNAPTVRVLQGVGIDVQLAAGERATLSRIDVIADPTAVATVGVRIQGGAVVLEDCRLRSGRDLTAQTAVVEATATQLVASFCRFEGGPGGTALLANDSFVSLAKTRCFGGTSPAGDGVVVQGGALHATDAWLLGGEDFGTGPGGAALRVAGQATVTLHDSAASGGMGQPAGSGLVNTGSAPVEHSADTFAGGISFPSLVASPDIVGPATLVPDLVGLSWSEPPYRRGTLRPGQPWSVNVVAPPNVLAAIAFAFGPGDFAPLITRQAALLPADIAHIEAMVTDAFGYGNVGGLLPNDPSLRGAALWAQAVAGAAFPLEASPPSAVVVR